MHQIHLYFWPMWDANNEIIVWSFLEEVWCGSTFVRNASYKAFGYWSAYLSFLSFAVNLWLSFPSLFVGEESLRYFPVDNLPSLLQRERQKPQKLPRLFAMVHTNLGACAPRTAGLLSEAVRKGSPHWCLWHPAHPAFWGTSFLGSPA